MDLQRAELIAKAYDDAPKVGPDAEEAYQYIGQFIEAQYHRAIREGWTFTASGVSSAPPTPTQMASIWQTKHLLVYDRDHGHPLLSDRLNYQFRAVHDVYGHGPSIGFDLDGEVLANQNERKEFRHWMYDHFQSLGLRRFEKAMVLGECALWCETVSQAAYFAARGKFPEQKAPMLLDHFRRNVYGVL